MSQNEQKLVDVFFDFTKNTLKTQFDKNPDKFTSPSKDEHAGHQH